MSKKRAKREQNLGRREFMQDLLLGGGAVAVTLVAGEAAAETATPESDLDKAKPAAGYQETPHIRDYYKTLAG